MIRCQAGMATRPVFKKIKQEHGKAFEKEASEVLHSCDYIKSERHNPAQTKAQQPES